MYTVQCTVNIVHCTVYAVHCTVYGEHTPYDVRQGDSRVVVDVIIKLVVIVAAIILVLGMSGRRSGRRVRRASINQVVDRVTRGLRNSGSEYSNGVRCSVKAAGKYTMSGR